MRGAIRALLMTLAVLAAPRIASARGRPTVATDAFYVGTRLSPGAALLCGWDLDVYLARSRAISVGPGVSIAVLGSDAGAAVRQDLLVAVDVARFKIQVNEPGEAWRPYFFLGGGFTYVRLAGGVETTSVRIPPDEDEASAERVFDASSKILGMLSFGAGADLFSEGPWALALALVTRARLADTERMPQLWTELLLGVRFGL